MDFLLRTLIFSFFQHFFYVSFCYLILPWLFYFLVQLTDFGLSKVGLINSTDDLSGPDVSTVLLSEHKPMPASVRAEIREQRRKQSAVGTPDYLAPEILLGVSHGLWSFYVFNYTELDILRYMQMQTACLYMFFPRVVCMRFV